MDNPHELILNDASCPYLDTDREPNGPRHLTSSQAAALRQLSALYEVRGQPKRGGITPRCVPCIVGPSGAGKTSVVSRLCDLEGEEEPLPLLVCLASSWCVFGSGSLQSLNVIKRFVNDHSQGVIFLDEIEKATPHEGRAFNHLWSMGVLGEIMSLIDALNGDTKLSLCGWSHAEISKLSNFFIVGAGAWMSIYEQSNKIAVGEQKEYADQISETCGIPTELFRRFNKRLIEITYPTKKDFRLAIRRIRSELELPALSDLETNSLSEIAVASSYGLRWLETYLTQLLIDHPEKRVKRKASKVEVTQKLNITKSALDSRSVELKELTFAAQRPVYELQVRLQRLVQIAKAAPDPKNHFNPIELQPIIDQLSQLSSGMEYYTAITEPQKVVRAAELLEAGEALREALDKWMAGRAFGLGEVGVLDLMIRVRVAICQILNAWTFVTGIQVNDAP